MPHCHSRVRQDSRVTTVPRVPLTYLGFRSRSQTIRLVASIDAASKRFDHFAFKPREARVPSFNVDLRREAGKYENQTVINYHFAYNNRNLALPFLECVDAFPELTGMDQ